MKQDTTTALATFIFIIYFIVCWIVNIVKFFNCDFESSYKEEIIHALGIFPLLSGITAWF